MSRVGHARVHSFEDDQQTGLGIWAGGAARTARSCAGRSNPRREEVQGEGQGQHDSHSHTAAGDGVGSVMDVLGDESDRDAGRDDDGGEACEQPQRTTAGSLGADEQDRGRDRDRGHGGGMATGEGQVFVSEPPDKWLEDPLADHDGGESAAEQEHHARPTPGEGGCAG